MHLTKLSLIISMALLVGPNVQADETRGLLDNSTFADGDGDGLPDNWKPFPPAKGNLTRMEVLDDGGLKFTDKDPGKGLGLEQWVEATPGVRYSATVTPGGSGGGFLYLTFAPKIPAKAANLSRIQLSETREWISAGTSKTVEAVAPAGTAYVRLWIYSPQGNTNCELTFDDIRLTASGEGAVKPSSKKPATPAAVTGGAFTDADGDGMADGWGPYPGGNGSSTRIELLDGGGVLLHDSNSGKGIGIERWVDVTPGTKYTTTVESAGSGGCFLYMIFAPRIPAQAGKLSAIKLSEKREWLSAGKPLQMTMTAPAGAQKAKIWIYSPNGNTNCDIVVKEVRFTEAGKADSIPGVAPPAPEGASSYKHYNPASILPQGELSVIDFETGDFSQIRSKEGGHKIVVSAPEPVRNGTYAMKVRMDHKHERSEITGYRSAAYGEYTYGWSIFIPEDFDGKSSFSIVTQWHDWGSGKNYIEDGGPPTSLYIANNTWRMKLRYQDGEGGNKLTKKEFELGSIEPFRGKWTDFVLEVNWQSPKSGGGYFHLYRNGEQIIDYEGPTWYEDKVQGPYFKMGVYKGAGSWKGDESNAYMYFDEFRMGDSSVTRDQVDPAKQPGADK